MKIERLPAYAKKILESDQELVIERSVWWLVNIQKEKLKDFIKRNKNNEVKICWDVHDYIVIKIDGKSYIVYDDKAVK